MSTANDRAAAFLSQVAYPGTVSNLTTNTARYLKDATRTGSGTARMKALFQNQYAAHTIATPGLVGYWRMDAASGTTELDRSGNGNSGTITGGVTLNQTGAISDGDAAQLFDGSSGYVSVADTAVLQLTATGTVEAWVYPTARPSVNAFGLILNKGNWASARNSFNCYFQQSDSSLRFEVDSGVAAQRVTVAWTNAPLNAWTYLALTWDGSTITAYVNGASVGTAVQSANPNTSGSNLFIGASAAAQDMLTGRIDEVAVYNVALTPAQILAKYSQI